VVTLFHYIEKERAWRKENGRPEGFETLGARKPIGESLIAGDDGKRECVLT